MKKQYKQKRPYMSANISRSVKVNAKHRCQVCGETSGLEIHHIDKNRENNNLDNLIYLCATCHRRADKGKIDRKSLKIYRNNNMEINKDELIIKKIEEILSYQFITSLKLGYFSDFDENTFLPFEKFLEECYNPKFKFNDSILEKNRLEFKNKIEYILEIILLYKEKFGDKYRIGPSEREAEYRNESEYWAKITGDFNIASLEIFEIYQNFF